MNFQNVQPLETAFERNDETLFTTQLFKATGETEDAWKFSGIASDEDTDIEGDRILRKSLDLTYANERGYVNWDHSREPEYQIGYLTKAAVVSKREVEKLRKSGFPNLSDSATVYMEGELYKGNPKAASVHEIMKSTPEGASGLGLSLDGALARDMESGGIVKAFVRGVAITSQPIQPKTLVRLMKSIQAYNQLQGQSELADLPAAIAGQVVEMMQKASTLSSAMSKDRAVLWVLQQRPNWSFDLAKKVVDYTIANKRKD